MTPALRHSEVYLQRLGFSAPPAPTLATLRELQRRHSAAFPFETLSTLLHAPVPLDLPSLERKLLHEGRGGYCFELNRLFLALLQRLGFDARALTGRVVMDGDEGTVSARTHMLVLVAVEGASHVVDVGFGGMVPTGPLRLDTDAVQETPHEPYRLSMHDGQYTLHAEVAGERRALYRFDLQPQEAIDLEVGNWYVSTHPDSPFLGQLRVARTGPGIRKTLGNGSFAIHRRGARSERRALPDADAVMRVLREEFELRLPPGPGLRVALDAWLKAGEALEATRR